MGRILVGNGIIDPRLADEKDLVFTTERNCLIEIQSDILTLNSSGEAEATHGLGYFPMYYAFVKSDPIGAPNTWTPLPYSFSMATDKLYVDLFDEESEGWKVFYMIFSNQIEDAIGATNSNIVGKIKAGRAGVDVPSAIDARQLAFMSGKNVFKVDKTLSQVVPQLITPPDIVETIIPHNLGYPPVSWVLASFPDNSGRMLPDTSDAFPSMSVDINEENIIITTVDFRDPEFEDADPYTINFKLKVTRDKIGYESP